MFQVRYRCERERDLRDRLVSLVRRSELSLPVERIVSRFLLIHRKKEDTHLHWYSNPNNSTSWGKYNRSSHPRDLGVSSVLDTVRVHQGSDRLLPIHRYPTISYRSYLAAMVACRTRYAFQACCPGNDESSVPRHKLSPFSSVHPVRTVPADHPMLP